MERWQHLELKLKEGFAPCFVLLGLSSYVPGASAQPSQGDWVVTGNEVVQNKLVVFNGNLYLLVVMNSGELVLTRPLQTVAAKEERKQVILATPRLRARKPAGVQ